VGFELETLTALDLAGLLIDGNAQGRAGAIEALVEKSGECILCGIVLRPFHPLWHAWSSVEARGCHGWKRRKRRKHPWRARCVAARFLAARFAAVLRSSGAARPHRAGQPQIAASLARNRQKAHRIDASTLA